jgi:hypothetical protein
MLRLKESTSQHYGKMKITKNKYKKLRAILETSGQPNSEKKGKSTQPAKQHYLTYNLNYLKGILITLLPFIIVN